MSRKCVEPEAFQRLRLIVCESDNRKGYTMRKYRVTSWGSMTLAALCWLLATGFAVEKVWQDGVQSWTLLASMPVLTLAVGVLLHRGFEDLRSWRTAVFGVTGIALALLALSVTLPASIGSSGQARDTAIAQAEASNRSLDVLREDLANVSATLNWAQKDMVAECGTGDGMKCKGKRSTVKALEDRKSLLASQLQNAPVERATTSGETRISWALTRMGFNVSEEGVRMVWPMLPPIAFELLCAFFMCMALGRKDEPAATADTKQTSFSAAAPEPLPAPAMFSTQLPDPTKPRKRSKRQAKKDEAIAAIRAQTLAGKPPSFRLVQTRYRLPKATASRWRAEAMKDVA